MMTDERRAGLQTLWGKGQVLLAKAPWHLTYGLSAKKSGKINKITQTPAA